MHFVKYLLPVLIATGLASVRAFAQNDSVAGQETSFERQLNEVDDQPLREFVQSKENIDVRDKATNLEISGDVRFEWRQLYEKGDVIVVVPNDPKDPNTKFHFEEDYRNLRGHGAVDYRDLPVSHNDWDVEFNLKIKYTYGRAWAATHLQFDNSAGIRGHNDCAQVFDAFFPEESSSSCSCSSFSSDFPILIRNRSEAGKGSGESSNINLKRAYMGYNIYADGVHRWDIEIGRRKLDDIFESEVEFSSRFDGVLLKYTSDLGKFADFYWYNGLFIIDERVNHVGYATEFGLLDIWDSGLDLRYSFIDWTMFGRNRCFIEHPYGSEFANSQISFSYHFNPFQGFCKKNIPAEFYGGFLVNHAATKNIFTHNKRKNLAWYLGLYVGEVDSKGDWAFDIEYVYVQAQAVSDCDVSSIGRGNILDDLFTDIVYDPAGRTTGDVVVIFDEEGKIKDILNTCVIPTSLDPELFALSAILPRRGNANFKGWRFEFLYAITDNLSLDLIMEHSDAEDKHIGGRHPYSNYEIEAIYAF